MESPEVVELARSLGVSATGPPTPLVAGLGGNELWRLPAGGGDVVVRVFPADRPTEVADREVVAHRFAAAHGLLVPPVLAQGTFRGRSVLVIGWVEGEPLSVALWRDGSPTAEWGRRCGAILARVHAIADQPPAPITSRSWIGWAGELPPGLQSRLREYPEHRLLHLDFHPENLIVTPGGELGILDWANVHCGPPQADLARTLSILELVRDAHPAMDDRTRAAVDVFTAGLLAGYAGAGGDARVPATILAWAYAVQVRDLAGSWVPSWYFERIRRRCRELTGSTPDPR